MSLQTRHEPVGRAPRNPRAARARWWWRQSVAWIFLALLLAAIVLGGPLHHGHALVHGGLLPLVPGGAIVLASTIRRGAGHAPDRDPIAAGFGLALIGVGMFSSDPAAVWRLLCLPGFVGFGVICLRDVFRRPSSQGSLVPRGTRGAEMWRWQGYAGSWVAAFVVCPSGIAWSLGLLRLH